jgi:hypothetical protein
MIHTVPVGPGGIPSTNNSVGTTGIVLGLEALNDPTIEVINRFQDYTFLSLQGNVLGRVHSTLQQGPDDYIAFFFACACINSVPAMKIMDNRDRFLGLIPRFWNNEAPGTSRKKDGSLNFQAIFQRFPGLIAQGKIAAGESLNILDKLVLSVTMILSSFKDKSVQDSWLQQDLIVKTYLIATIHNNYPQSWLVEKAINFWEKRKPAKIADIFREYSGNKDHPIADLWIENEEIKT